MNLSISAAARETPNGTALVAGCRSLTFRELAEEVRTVAVRFSECGLSASSPQSVALSAGNDLASVVLLLALIEGHHPALLLSPRLTPAEREGLLQAWTPGFVLDPTSLLARPMSYRLNPSPRAAQSSDWPLAVVQTSGTSGGAKGVVLSRHAMQAAARASERNLRWMPEDRWLLSIPVSHVGGLSVVTRCLLARRGMVLSTPGDPEEMMAAILQHRVTLASLVPTQLKWMLESTPTWDPPAYLRAILVGGAAAPPGLLAEARRRGWPVLPTYGLSESGSQVATLAPGAPLSRSVGAPLPGVLVRVRDGRVELGGPTLASGYYPARPGGARKECPVLGSIEPLPLTAEGWFQTGDLGRLDETGALEIFGRSDDVIVTGGNNVYPWEVEAVLLTAPRVLGACVFGVEDPTWGQLVAAALIPSDPPPTLEQLAAHVQATLPTHQRPRRVALVKDIERTSSGKPNRSATARRCRQQLVTLSTRGAGRRTP